MKITDKKYVFVFALSALLMSCNQSYELERTIPDTYQTTISGVSLSDSLKLMFDGQEVARGTNRNSNRINFRKELLFKEGIERKFELRTADERDSLISAFAPNFEIKEDFNYQFLYAPDMGGLVTGLSMPEPAEGMMNFKIQFTTPLSEYNEPVDIVFEYSETDYSTWEETFTPIITIKNYMPNSGFHPEPIETHPPKMGEIPFVPGQIQPLENISVKIYKAGTEEFYHTRIRGAYFLGASDAKMLEAGDQEWIVLTERGRNASRLNLDAKYLSQYFSDN